MLIYYDVIPGRPICWNSWHWTCWCTCKCMNFDYKISKNCKTAAHITKVSVIQHKLLTTNILKYKWFFSNGNKLTVNIWACTAGISCSNTPQVKLRWANIFLSVHCLACWQYCGASWYAALSYECGSFNNVTSDRAASIWFRWFPRQYDRSSTHSQFHVYWLAWNIWIVTLTFSFTVQSSN